MWSRLRGCLRGKDLLCALFFMLSIMAYLRYATLHFPCGIITSRPSAPFLNPTRPPLNVGGGEGGVISRGGKRWYLISLLFFILALLSKPMAVTLPVVLLMLDWYPLGRIQSFKTARTAIVEKFPFMALSIISSILTVLAQQAGGAITSIEVSPLSTRIPVAAKALIIYLWKMVLPLDLSPFYPYPREASLFSIEYFLAIVLVAGITIASVVIAKRQKLWLSAWGYYVITLLPVLGIVQVGLQSMADRYTYLPSLGPFLVIGIMASWVWARAERLGEKSQVAKVLAVAASVLVIVSLSYATFKQIAVWKNSIVFWSYVIEKEPERVPVAYYNRGIAFFKMGMSEMAIADYGQAIALKPSYYDAYNNRGLAFEKIGLLDMAIKDLEAAMAMKPSSPEAYNNIGKIYRKTGQFDAAIEKYNRVIELMPSYHEAYYNRAIVYEKMGQVDRAIEDYNRAIELKPSYYEAYNNLGVLYGNAAVVDKAKENFTRAITLNPGLGGAYVNRGVSLCKNREQ